MTSLCNILVNSRVVKLSQKWSENVFLLHLKKYVIALFVEKAYKIKSFIA